MTQAKALPDPRSPIDRRQRDGLGLLPRATTPAERRRRQQLNQLIGGGLMLLGVSTSLANLVAFLHMPAVAVGIGVILGLLLTLRGWQLVTWRERRKADRRGTGRPTAPPIPPEPTPRPRLRFGRPSKAKAAELQVKPPEVD